MDLAAPWPRRLYWWLDERFPPVAYSVLVLLFHASAVMVATTLGKGGRSAPAAAIVVWLAFLHLRLFDEHKDHAADAAAYPDRVLSRGLVTLPMLGRLAAVVVAVQAIVAAGLGASAFGTWFAAFAFSVAMRFEFGVGRWLSRRLVLYAVTHNPIVALLALFLHAASGAAWHPGFLWYVLFVSIASLGFELGRKIRLPGEEHAGVRSYTTDLGQAGARGLLLVVESASVACLAALGLTLGATPTVAFGVAVLVAIPGCLTATGRQPAKRVELGATLTLLLGLLGAAALAWSAP